MITALYAYMIFCAMAVTGVAAVWLFKIGVEGDDDEDI